MVPYRQACQSLSHRNQRQISGGIVLSELERIRMRLHTAMSVGMPREEILKVSRHLDELIISSMKANQEEKKPSLHCGSL